MANPVVKWAGGKRQILDAIKECLPPESNVNNYHEPFFGGGALFFDTAPHTQDSTINDINKRLMNFYRVIQNDPDDLIAILRNFESPTSEPNPRTEFSNRSRKGKEISSYYYQQRELFNKRPNNECYEQVEEAALLLYLNRTCYNGLYRENSSGEFNVPIGRHSGNPNWVQAHRIDQASKYLDKIDIFNRDFSYIEKCVQPNDLVYFDPPYKPVSKSSSFVEYHSGAFDDEEQTRLRDIAVDLHKKGVYIVVSNSPKVSHKYEYIDEFEISNVGAKRHINSVPEDRDEVQEILITNVPKNNRREETKVLNAWTENRN